VRTEINGIPVQLRLSMSEIRVADRPERLYTLENLSAVLDEREATAWRDLIRVMTHEIMNTLTPITSLAETANTLLADSHDPDAREAVATIARRSARLLGFVERYRELLKIPDPMLEKVSVRELLDDVVKLLGSRLQGISMRVSVIPESLGVDADRALLDQVLINLLGNAIDAVANQADPEIRLTAHLVRGRTAISVSDSGPGIPPAIREQIFIPFFTTKPEGSGIGLALSRQIVRAHGAELTLAAPVEGAGATFTLHF
jgi:C4-dicarboxylate-specific signal transduction histidine kinase